LRSKSLGVAETNTICGVCARNSSNVCGRLSSALGSRKPNSTSVFLRERSPSNMPPIWGTVWWDSSMKQTKSSGKKSSRQKGRSPGARPSRMRE
jgi:hypothetical protein